MGNGASSKAPEKPYGGCTGDAKADAYTSLGTHAALGVTAMVPFVGCAAAIADAGLTGAEESGLLCGGELKTPDAGWQAVNVGLAATGTVLSCIPGIGTVFGLFKGLFTSTTRATKATVKAIEMTAVGASKSKAAAVELSKAVADSAVRAKLAAPVVTVGRVTGKAVVTTQKTAVLTEHVTAVGGKDIEALAVRAPHADVAHAPKPHEKPALVRDVGEPRVTKPAPKPRVTAAKGAQFSAEVLTGVAQYVAAKIDLEDDDDPLWEKLVTVAVLVGAGYYSLAAYRKPSLFS